MSDVALAPAARRARDQLNRAVGGVLGAAVVVVVVGMGVGPPSPGSQVMQMAASAGSASTAGESPTSRPPASAVVVRPATRRRFREVRLGCGLAFIVCPLCSDRAAYPAAGAHTAGPT